MLSALRLLLACDLLRSEAVVAEVLGEQVAAGPLLALHVHAPPVEVLGVDNAADFAELLGRVLLLTHLEHDLLDELTHLGIFGDYFD